MLTFKTPSGIGEVENCWADLTPAQFIETVALTNRFLAGEFTLDDYRLCLLQMLTGYKRSKRLVGSGFPSMQRRGAGGSGEERGGNFSQKPGARSQRHDTINENLFLLSEQLTFAIRPKAGPAEVLEFFTPELRKMLETRFPWEIHEPEHVAQLVSMKNNLKIQFDINFNIGRNPLQYLRFGETILQGPTFEADENEINTNLKAGAYIDAHAYFNAYSQTRNRKYLDRAILCLYKPVEMEQNVEAFDFTDEKVKDAVAFVFIFIEQTLVTDPVFSLLYTRDGEQPFSNKINLGPDAVIGQMVTAGFGTYESIVNLDIRAFFNLQVLMLRQNIETLRGYGKNNGEIAKTLKIPMETVIKL